MSCQRSRCAVTLRPAGRRGEDRVIRSFGNNATNSAYCMGHLSSRHGFRFKSSSWSLSTPGNMVLVSIWPRLSLTLEKNPGISMEILHISGGVPERSNGTVSKTVVGGTPPRVRIPAPPPLRRKGPGSFFVFLLDPYGLILVKVNNMSRLIPAFACLKLQNMLYLTI